MPARIRNLQVDGERLWASLMELAQIGATEKGGVCRLAASDLDGEARRLFIRWCEEAGCTVTIDRIGNIFARRPGRDPALPPVIAHASLQIGSAILVEAGLSFLGLGDPNVVSWGAMLNDAQQFIFNAWWMSVFPGLAIMLTVLGVNLVADALIEAWDPRLASE